MSDPLETNHLSFLYLAAPQPHKRVTHNEALRRLDTVVQLARCRVPGLATPPGSPTQGDRYIVADDVQRVCGRTRTARSRLGSHGAWNLPSPTMGGWRSILATETILVRLSGDVADAAAAAPDPPICSASTRPPPRPIGWPSAPPPYSSPAVEAANGGTADIRFVVNKETDLTQPRYSSRAPSRGGRKWDSPATPTSSSRFRRTEAPGSRQSASMQ